jgi:hypothetical protein
VEQPALRADVGAGAYCGGRLNRHSPDGTSCAIDGAPPNRKITGSIEPRGFPREGWAGATFDPSGETLFVNIQDPGITFAITGPQRGGTL